MCILVSGLKTVEVLTIFRTENPRSVLLFSGLEILEVLTIFRTENLGSVYYLRD